MAVIEKWFKCDLQKPVRVVNLDGGLFLQDDSSNQIGVIVTDNGDPAILNGSVIGSIIRADGVSITVEGDLEENKVWIVLPDVAYAVVGPIQISIRLIDGEEKTTLVACTGYVHRTITNTIIDEDALYTIAVIPDLPSTNGTYTLQATVNNGTVTYEWV